ncbi:Low affinity potassium transport system protein kup [Rhodococcus opacus]|nr:Low affinity potassium transport system protein kup [Rhodococcus opacus]
MTAVLAGLGVFGAALVFGDSVIAPAISVLSAVEGLKVVQPGLEELIVPITAVIIVGLFSVQRRGTAAVGRLFGPVMFVWFVSIGACGVAGIARHPEILRALSTTYALNFMFGHFGIAFFALTAVVLAVTGAEALYADMGHFGRPAITRGWLLLVLPACVLSYLGQGALLLGDQGAVGSPFFLLAPGWARLPMVLLATAATVIDSQAVITGAYSALPVPRVPDTERTEVDRRGYAEDGIVLVTVYFGYMETPNIPDALRLLDPADTEGPIAIEDASYFLSKIELAMGTAPTMATWRKRLFIAASYITGDAAEYFRLPGERTVIMGSRIDV